MADNPARILSVTELNRMAREVLERSFPLFWVSGEICNLTRAASGHWYFALKDGGAQVRCVMFRGRNTYIDWQPRDGDQVEARAVVTLYEARGEFQLTIEFLQRAGLGTLFEAFEKLKAKLQAEGLFDAAHKKTIPAHPVTVGVVTSPDGAALHDVLTTLRRRMPSLKVVIYPTQVQGKGVARLIASAIATADARQEVDVLIVCRGGGSMEDLWQFNEEEVARAIHACSIPVISGVGHETDFTIADFVADHRSATPTAAAELVSSDRQALLRNVQQLSQRLERTMQNYLGSRAQKLDYLSRRLLSPAQQLAHKRQHLSHLAMRMQYAIQQQLRNRQAHVIRLSQNFAHLNPQSVLKRGYTLVTDNAGHLVSSTRKIKPGQSLNIAMQDGRVQAKAEMVMPNLSGEPE